MPASPRPSDPPPPDARDRLFARITILMGVGLIVLDGSVVNVALPALTVSLDTSPSDVVWVLNAYQLAVLSLLLPFSALGDRLGYRRVNLVGLVLFSLAAAGSMLADSLHTLVLARGVQGIAGAAVMSVNTALIRLVFPGNSIGKGLALNSATVAAATAAGPSLGGLVLSVASWPWLFAATVPCALGLALLGLRTLPANPTAGRRGERIGAFDVLLNAAMFSLVFFGASRLSASLRADGTAGSVATGLGLLTAAAAVGAFYLSRERRKEVPLFPVDLLRIRIFALSMATSVTAFTAYTLATIALPFLMLTAWHLSPAQTGLAMTAMPLALVAVSPVVARMIGRVPGGLLGGIGLTVLAIGLVLLATLPHDPPISALVWRMAVCGMGFGIFQSPNNHIIVTSPPLSRAGAASGMLGTARLTGQTTGAVAAAAIFGVASVSDGSGPLIALGLGATLAVAAAGVSLLRLRVTR